MRSMSGGQIPFENSSMVVANLLAYRRQFIKVQKSFPFIHDSYSTPWLSSICSSTMAIQFAPTIPTRQAAGSRLILRKSCSPRLLALTRVFEHCRPLIRCSITQEKKSSNVPKVRDVERTIAHLVWRAGAAPTCSL